MAENQDKIKKLYDTFVSDGYEMESEEDFRKNLSDAKKRRAAYDALVNDGYQMESYDEFEANIGFAEPTAPQSSVLQEQKILGQENDVKEDSDDALSEEDKILMTNNLNQMAKRTKQTTDTFNEHVDNLREYSDASGSLSSQTVKGKSTLNTETGQLEDTYITPAGNRYDNKALADLESSHYRQVADMSVASQIRNAEKRLADINERLNKRGRELREEHENNKPRGIAGVLHAMGEAYGADKMGGSANQNPEDWMEFDSDSEYQSLRLAARKAEEEIQQLKNAKQREDKGERFWHDFGRNTAQEIFKADAWDFGKNQLRDARTMLEISTRAQNGEELSESDEDALLEMYMHNNVMSQFGDLGRGSRWGTTTGASLSFMKDFIITGGFSGLTTKLPEKIAVKMATKAATKAGTRAATEALGVKVAKEGLYEFVRNGGKKAVGNLLAEQGMLGTSKILATKALGVTAEDLLIRAPLMTTTVRGRNTAANIIETKLGPVIMDEETGELRFTDDKSWSNAAWQAGADDVIENFSEMWGEHLPGIADVSKTFGARNLTAAILRSTRENAGTLLSKTSNFLSKAGVNGYFGEVGEEYYGQLWRSMLNLDSAYKENADGTRTNLFADGQFHGDIWGGMALSVGFTGGGTMALNYGAGKVVDGARYVRYKHAINIADAKASELLTPGVWSNMKLVIDAADNGDMGDIANQVMSDSDMTDEQRAAIMDYMEKSLIMRGNNLKEYVEKRDGVETIEIDFTDELSQSYIDGYNSTSSQEMNDAKNLYEYHRQRISELVSDDFLIDIDAAPLDNVDYVRTSEDWNDEERGQLIDYINARQVYQGMIQRVRDDIDSKIQQSNSMIASRTNRTTGKIQGATMKQDDRKVYVISGNLVSYEDGTGIDINESDDSIIIRDAETGALEQVSPDAVLSIDEAQDPFEQQQLASDAIRAQFAQAAADQIDGVVTFNLGDEYTITGEDGTQTQVQIAINDQGLVDNGDGTVNVIDESDKIFPISKDVIQQSVDAANIARVAEFEQQRTVENLAHQQAEQEAVRPQYAMNDLVTLRDENGNGIRGNITADADADGLYEVFTEDAINGKRVNLFSRDELDSMLMEHNGETIEQSVPESVNNVRKNAENSENTAEIVPKTPENVPDPIESVPAEQSQVSALSRIPQDEQGNPIYEQAETPELAWDAIVEQTDGDETMAQTVADGMVADMESALKKLEKSKAKGGNTIAEKIAAEKERNIAIANAKNALNIWKNIAQTAQRRKDEAEAQHRRELEAQAALRKAEEDKQRAEREEAERIEREALNGVPDMADDTPQDARARGYRRVAGHKIERQQPIRHLQGKDIEVKFSDSVIKKGRVAVIDAAELQPSHIQGVRNPAHFIDEAQPKERNDAASVMSARKIAGNIRPEEITTSVTAYTGAPTVNTRGEVIQGNNRSDALRLMWDGEKEQSEVYKQYLKDHADEFGLNADEIESMERPVLVNMLDVEDSDAINLGQFVAQDTESGGIERIKPKNAVQKMGTDMSSFANMLLASTDDETSFAGLVDRNGAEVLRWMNQQGYITPTQYKSAFDSKGAITAEAKNDLKGIMYQSIFQGGNTRLEEMFNAMPAKAQRAILATAFRDYDSPNAERMVTEIQNSIRAYNALSQDESFVAAKNWKDARIAVEGWKMQYLMDDVTGESYLPAEKFSNFALHLATMYKGESQGIIQSTFNQLYDLIQGTQEETLFEKPDNTPRTLVQAIKETLNIDYNGQQRSNVLAGDSAASQERGQRSNGHPTSGERIEGREQSADDTGRAVSDDAERGGQRDIRHSERRQQDNLDSSERGVDYRLSDEVDENGRQFVLNSQGDIEFGKIKEKSGLTPAPILLSEGIITNPATNDGYGLVHIEARHGEQIRKAGFESVIAFIEEVANNYERIREGNDRAGNPTYMLQITDKHNNTLIVELSGDGTYWNVNTAGIFKNSYGKNRKVVYDRHATEKQPTEVAVESQDVEQGGTQASSSMNSTTSGDTLQAAASKPHGGTKSTLTGANRDTTTQIPDLSETSDSKVRENISTAKENADTLVGKTLINKTTNQKIEITGYHQHPNGINVIYEGKMNGKEMEFGSDFITRVLDSDVWIEENETSITLGQQIAAAEEETNTTPTEAQKEAGNYKKGHVQVGTFNVTIENPKGSIRSGVDATGAKWETEMHNTYGYIRGTEGVDGDHIDVFLSDNIDEWNGRRAYIVDQYNPDGTFDEHKVMLGFNADEDAQAAYLSNYEKCWEKGRRIEVSSVNMEDFEAWIDSSHRKTKPFAEYKSVKNVETSPIASSKTEDYSIEPAQYTTKRGKVLDMQLVKFGRELTKEEQRNAKSLAKELKGWYDSKQGGFMMRNDDDAKQLVDAIMDESGETLADAAPVSLDDVRKVNVESLMDALSEAKPKNEGAFGLVSDARMEELKARLRNKLGGQLNMGIDPEVLAIGMELAVGHIDRGVKSFADFARKMVEDLGDAIRPYLKAFYNGARDLPEVIENGLSAEMTSYDEVSSFDVANFDKNHSDPFATADMVVSEQEKLQQAEEAKHEIVNQRNTERRKINEQKEADTEAVVSEAEAVVSEAESDIENAADESQLNEIADNIDKQIEKVNEQLALLGYYEAEEVEKDFNEMYGYMRNAEKKAVKDANSLAKKLVEDLGIAASTLVDSKGKKLKNFARANIAPAGGDIYIEIPLGNERALEITLRLDPDRQDNLYLIDGYTRIRNLNPQGKEQRWSGNVWINRTETYQSVLKKVQSEIKHNMPSFAMPVQQTEKTDAEHMQELVQQDERGEIPFTVTEDAEKELATRKKADAPFKIGDRVMYKGKQATIYSIDSNRPVLDTGLAPVLYEETEWEDLSPVTQNIENKSNNKLNSKKKSVSSQTELADLFGGLFDEETLTENKKDNGLQGNDAVRTGELSANGSGHKQGLSNSSEKGSESKSEAGRGLDTGRKGAGVEIDRSVRPRLSDSVESNLAPSERKNIHNNHSERGVDHAPTSVDARIEANIKALELAQKLIESGEQATEQQMKVLRKFSGWGGLGKAFNEKANYTLNGVQYWNEPTPENKRIRELLGSEAYQEAVMSANSAYYTPAYVVDTLWDIAAQMGFKGGNILEGSAGIGNILGQMPTSISERSDIHAIEIDRTSGGILSLLYPDAKVEIQGFEETRIPNGSVDLAITNVPFVTGLRVNDTTGDKDLSKKFHNIHDFCIAKNVRKLREGGIGIFITSNGTLDNSKALRDWIVSEGGADFIGAFRMNNKTFGGTGVTSDIIVIRKRVNGRKSANAIDVSIITGERSAEYNTGETRKVKGESVAVVKHLAMDYNRYFIEHPENMAGVMQFAFEQGDTFRPTSKGLYPAKGKNQEQMLSEFVHSFKEEVEDASVSAETTNSGREYIMDASAGGKKLGELYVKDGALVIAGVDGYYPLSVNANKVKGHSKVECFNAYAAIKEALTEVLDYQTQNDDDEGLKPLLAKLNKAYDRFVSTYGHFNKNTAIAFLRNDVDFPNVFSLEKFEETGDKSGKRVQKFGKADVLSQRVVEKVKELTPTNIKDGIIASVFKFGRIDAPYIAEQLGKSVDDVKSEILSSGYGFEDPASRQIEVSYQYLSGNVREKLRQAQENNTNGEYDANIKALQEVIPMDIPAHLIDFTLGSSWIDPKLYEDYVNERTDIEVKFTSAGGTWYMDAPYYVNKEKNRAMGVYSEMFKQAIYGHTLIEAAITNKTITVSRTNRKWDGSTETITDKDATQACAAKIDEIRQDFKDWARQKMQSDSEMSSVIKRIYNDTFNNFVPMSIPDDFVPEYFGGASHKFKMRPHQGRAIVRGTMQPLLLAHEVGTGKTFTLISTAMEMRRLGTAHKPMIVVQNATVGQFVASAKELYPNAKILTLEESDRTAEGRKNFYAKIRHNDWDMIVVPQSTFEFIPDSEERQMQFVQDKIEEKLTVLEKMKEADPRGESLITRQAKKEISDLEAQLADLSDEASKKRTASEQKKREVTLQNAEVQALEMLDRRTDDIENFDDMGIDALLLDEAHEYKHLGFATAMQRGVKGVDSSYSKKSQGVYLKTQAILEKNNGRNVIFATGTPISNTAAEIWTFMRYLMPADTMKEYGIYYFDDFVRNFGNIQQMLEFTTSGKFKENNRFAGYVNLPELVRIWSGVSDIVRTKEAGGVNDKIPDMEDGKAQDLYLPQTRALRSIMKYVKAELMRYEEMSGKEKKANSHIPLTMYGIAKSAAVDARLVDSSAEDDPNSKTNEAVRQTLRSLKETSKYKGTVAIFSDI